MNAVWQDARYALRALWKRRGFAAVAVLTLALGVGASTAVFSVTDAVLLSPPPFAQPQQLFVLSRANAGPGASSLGPWSYPDFEILREQTRSFDVAAFSTRTVALSGEREPVRARAELVSPDYFALLGLQPAIGRALPPAGEAGARPLLLAHHVWRTRFGGDANAIGRTVALDGVAFEIVGVAPEGFRGQGGNVDLWAPITEAPALMNDARRLTRAFSNWMYVIARLRDEATPAGAASELNLLASRLRDLREEEPARARGVAMIPLAAATTEPQLRRTLVLLLGAAALVLLLACANLANLLLARAVERGREMALRRALGAGGGRLVRQFLTESALLGLLGGAAGLVLALAGIRLLALVRPDQPLGIGSIHGGTDLATLELDVRVLIFNFAAAFGAALLFGLAPAAQALKVELAGMLGTARTAPSMSLRRAGAGRGRAALSAAQIAIAVVLLMGAGVLLESLMRLRSIDVGFRANDVLSVGLRLPPQKYDQERAAQFYDQLVERVRGIPGVGSAAIATSLPVSRNSSATRVVLEGRAPGENEEPLGSGYHLVSAGYFEALGVPVLRGRSFDARDRPGAARVAIINQTAAQLFFGGDDPLGKRIWLGAGYGPQEDLAEIVGVVGDVKYGAVEEPAAPHAYLAAPQYMEDVAFLLVRMQGGRAAALVAAVRAELAAMDAELPLFDVQMMDARLRAASARTRFGTTLLGIFALIACCLAAVGVYGVMSFSVAARTREIGIRRALGATGGSVVRQVMREGGIVALLGVVLGIAGALAASRVLQSQLYEVQATDVVTLALVAATMLAAALLATWVPSRRAARVDPLSALRME